MTYRVGMKCEQGLIAIADTRLTSGTAVSTGKTIAVHQDGDHAMFVLTSGLRSVREKAITYFEERLAEHEMSLDRMYKAANMLAGEIRRVYMEDEEWLRRSGLVFDLNCIIGGQMSGDTEHHLYQIYPQGNWIEVGEGSPHAIIGEGSYGKVILDRSWHYDSRLDRGLLVGLLSFDATQTSASAVGPPVDTLVYHRGTYQMTEHRFTAEDLTPIAAQWGGAIEAAVEQAMPTIAWHAGALGIQTGPDRAAGWPTVAGNPMFTPDPQFTPQPEFIPDPQFTQDPQFRPQPPFTPGPQFTQDPQFRPQPPFTPGPQFTQDPQFRPQPPFTPGPQFTQDPQFTAQPPFAPEPWQNNPSEP